MRKRIFFIISIGLLVIFLNILFGKSNHITEFSMSDSIDSVVENVTVTNVEIPVRVLCDGKPVTNLTSKDFVLFENKKKMNINGFDLKRKSIKINRKEELREFDVIAPSRTFVLIFRLTEFNRNVEKAVEYLINNIFRRNDRILVFANEKTYEFNNLQNKDQVKTHLIRYLKKESQQKKQEVQIYINKIEGLLDKGSFEQVMNPGYKFSIRIHAFLKEYSLVWKEYKKRFLSPRIDHFYYFSRYLENLSGEKWVLNFYQLDLFPNLRLNNKFAELIRRAIHGFYISSDSADHVNARKCENLLEGIMIDMSVSKNFPIEEISKLFYKVNATFHSFFIHPIRKGNVNEVDYTEVSSDIEKTLKRITFYTGGQTISSNNLVQSIDTITESEDVYYILSYSPQNPKKAGKIEILVREPENKEYQVLYDDNFNVDYITDYFKSIENQIKLPEIKVSEFDFRGKTLSFMVRHFNRRVESSQYIGHVKIEVQVINKEDNSSVFNQQKTLNAEKEELRITIPAFQSIKKGEYNFIIHVEDLLTNKEDILHQNVMVR